MEIIEKKDADLSIFELDGRLDSHTSVEFDEKMFASIDTGTRRVIVDCGKLDYITSAGLRVLNKTAKRLKKEKGAIVLCALEEYVREVFEIAGFDTFLPIVNDLDEALSRIE
ncbi:MAG: STAS domain-containing protein [Desulfobacterales bacterium]